MSCDRAVRCASASPRKQDTFDQKLQAKLGEAGPPRLPHRVVKGGGGFKGVGNPTFPNP